ncbi:MAG: hypothetical protein F4013_02955 [Gammaproteobacteria bacterium]|nr:hypothetical protein [Gammaproteobacteria bacterium]MYL00673.1 hypothetical protein [Gammaproteobacteria bacterium]
MTRSAHYGFVIGAASLLLAIAAPVVAWSPATPGPVLILPALLGALVALVLGAWRLAILTVWFGAAGPAGFSLVADSPFASEPDPLVTAIVFLIGAAMAIPLGMNYLRARAAQTQRQLPEARGVVRKRLGVCFGILSVALALIALSADLRFRFALGMLFSVPTTGLSSGFGALYATVPGLMYAPMMGLLGLLGAIIAILCGAWRTAALAIFLATPTMATLMPVWFGPAEYQVIYPLMGLAALCAFLLWHYQQSRNRKRPMTHQDA